METDEIADYLDALDREDCYRVDEVLKESPYELTQKVCFVGANGAEQGPYIRKFISRESGMGHAYKRIYEAQQLGRRFVHLPRIIECYDHDDDLAIVMEYVNGETLQDYVCRLDPSPALAAEVFPQLCDAVAELHEGFNPPIIHRDLKPSNIVLSQGGLTVIDLGIAREFKDGAEMDTVRFGTREFAPPEQFGFGQTTVRSDVYALGMVLYFCLTETIPTSAVREAGFTDPRIPGPIRDVIVQATAFSPEARFASVRALKMAFLAVGPATARVVATQPSKPTPSEPLVEFPQSSDPPSSQPVDGHASGARQYDAGAGLRSEARATAPQQKERWRIAGIVWNAFLALFTVGFFAYSFAAVGNPSDNYAHYSLFYRVVVLGFLSPVFWLCIVCFLADKRRLRVRFPVLAKVKWWHIVVGFIALLLVAAILVYAVDGPVG